MRLFDRTTRSVALTVLGQRFLAQVRGLVEDLDRSVLHLRDAAQLEAGDVTVGCVFSAVHHFLPPVIQAFREQHPRVLVRIIEEGAQPAPVVGVPLEQPAIARTIGMIRRAGRSLSPAADAFARLLTQASRATARTGRRRKAS